MENGLFKRVNTLGIMFICTIGMAACSKKADRATVSGAVTLDNQPLNSGIIRFAPTDGRTAPSEAKITDGKFNVDMPLGEKRVSISAPKVVGQRKVYETPDSPTVDITQELIPARYNAQTELTFTAAPGSHSKDFDLSAGK
jgi:hypothetical protein